MGLKKANSTKDFRLNGGRVVYVNHGDGSGGGGRKRVVLSGLMENRKRFVSAVDHVLEFRVPLFLSTACHPNLVDSYTIPKIVVGMWWLYRYGEGRVWPSNVPTTEAQHTLNRRLNYLLHWIRVVFNKPHSPGLIYPQSKTGKTRKT